VKAPKKFVGTWRITATEVWEKDDLDLAAPAHITFQADGLGDFQVVAVQGEIDARYDGDRVEFTWAGDDDGTEVSGRGWGEIGEDGKLRGRLYFHLGDDSSFVASRKKA
jgi:hypothetical protein